MEDNLTENPEVGLAIFVAVRKRGETLERVRLRTPAELALVPSLLTGRWPWDSTSDDTDSEAASAADIDEQRRAAVRLGLLVGRDEVPATAEDLRFRCDVDEETLRLMPRARVAEVPQLPPRALELNPRLYVQEGTELPEEVAVRDVFASRTVTGPSQFSAARPVVWVTDPTWDTLAPLWCGGTWGADLRRVAVDGAAPSTLSAESARALQLAGVLVPQAKAVQSSSVPGAASFDKASSGQEIMVLRDIFSPVFLAGLRRHFRRMRAEGYFSIDGLQVVNQRSGMYCDVVTLFIQQQLTRVVSHWTGTAVRPSYTWFMNYLPGAELRRHRDRPQCRWNVSFCIDTEPDVQSHETWPFYIESKSDSDTSKIFKVNLNVGDAVIYSGTDQEHWRDVLAPGHQMGMGFLHYVDADFEGGLK
ncbi:hypothetical protein ABZ608_36740 [Streptomyces sp. NPDC013172]|uniref:hypothetical protein n=1 Tax=Streptomyces sp. NPDC013172 TaxID=3155009 RepID=UPI0033FB921E